MENLLIEMVENLIVEAGYSLDDLGIKRIDLDYIVRMTMQPEEIKAVVIMIQCLTAENKMSKASIMTEVLHDLAGFKAVYLNVHDACFAPRCSGYASLLIT